jgi:prepilin-type N-terminal cleavage/methylation domain-containing protein
MRVSSTDRRRSQSGMTLVELLVALIITSIISTMLIVGWIDLQRSSAFALRSNDMRSSVRDALARVSSELRNTQPTVLPTTSATPATAPVLITTAQPMDVRFYSVYNNSVAVSDPTGTNALRLTRIWLDTTGSTTQKPQSTLYWQRDTNNNGSLDSGDRKMVLAKNVVNSGIANNSVTPATSYSAIFTYWYLNGANIVTADTVTGANLNAIVGVQVRIIADDNLQRPPAPVDLMSTVRLRNTSY